MAHVVLHLPSCQHLQQQQHVLSARHVFQGHLLLLLTQALAMMAFRILQDLL